MKTSPVVNIDVTGVFNITGTYATGQTIYLESIPPYPLD